MATDAQSLATQGSCYACGGLASMYEIFKLSLLAQISLGQDPARDVTPQGLLTQAQCFECSTYASQAQLMELALLQQIAGG